MKHLRKLLAVLLVLCACVFMMGASKASKTYEKAQDAMAEGNYAEAAELFDSISSYEDSSMLSMYCKACALGAEGQYKAAVSAFQSLGDYKDSSYYIIYYNAMQGKDAAKDDPLTYLDAAAIFDTIPLFKDSTAQSAACSQALYDAAVAAMSTDINGIAEARTYFDALGDFSDSAEQLAECTKLCNVKVETPPPVIIDSHHNRHLAYEGPAMYVEDLLDGQAFLLYVQITNDNPFDLEVNTDVYVDGSHYTYDPVTLEAASSTYCNINSNDEYGELEFSIGEHTVLWYVNNVLYASYTYEVKEGMSELQRQDEKDAANLSIMMGGAVCDEDLGSYISGKNIRNLFLDKLQDKTYYCPALIIFKNKGENSLQFDLSLYIDSEEYSYWAIDVDAGENGGANYASNIPLTSGEHTAVWYYNNTILLEETFTVYETMAEAEEAKLAATTVAEEDVEYEDTQVWEYSVGLPTGYTSASMTHETSYAWGEYYYDNYLDQFSDIYMDISAGMMKEIGYEKTADFYTNYMTDIEQLPEGEYTSETFDIDGEEAVLIHAERADGENGVLILFRSDKSDRCLIIQLASEDHVSCAKYAEFLMTHIAINDETMANFRETMLYLAADLMKSKEYDDAIAIYTDLKEYHYEVDDVLLNECNYEKAAELVSSGELKEALSIYSQLSEAGYRDASDRLTDCAVACATQLKNEGSYNDAWSYVESYLADSSDPDAKSLITDLKVDTYNAAVKAYESGSYRDAKNLFSHLPSIFKSTSKYLTLCSYHMPAIWTGPDRATLDDVIRLIPFEDSADIVVQSTNNACKFLEGTWKTQDGQYYFTMTKHSDGSYTFNTSMQYPQLSGASFDFKDGKYILSNGTSSKTGYKFTVVTKNNIKVYNYQDSKTYVFIRQ